MTFFARPNLDNTQFKQLAGSELTLSGQTQIATITGLTLTDGSGSNIPVTASGASSNFDVLTYCNGSISLLAPTASGGTGVYDCASPTTCSVGGLLAGTAIYGSGVTSILECILVPTLFPILTNPSISSFAINPTTTIYEVGDCPNITGTACFNGGCINPDYPPTACECRTDGTLCYIYDYMGTPYESCVDAVCNSCLFPSQCVTNGNNYISAIVCYCNGVQPYDSSCSAYSTALVTSATTASQINVCGLFPWFWGIESSGGVAAGVNRPTSDCIKSLITGGTTCKCVDTSNGTIYVNFDSTSDDYLWFAIPDTSTDKTCWYETALNSGVIGGGVSAGGNLFPNNESVSDICSSSPVWSGQTYKIYVSNYQSCSTTIIELRNS